MDKQKTSVLSKIKWGRVVGLIAGLIILSLVTIKSIGLYQKVHGSWEEIKFAYTNTEVVRTIRTDYQNKVQGIEDSYKQHDPTPEQQLIDEVVKQMQSSKTSR